MVKDKSNNGKPADGTYEKVLSQPYGTRRHVRIVTIGAGASGLNVVRSIRKHLDNYEHVVYEKNDDIGGTWYENRYPGVKCDIASHNYQFSWRPNPEWSSFFSPGEEIQDYLKDLHDDERLGDNIKLSHKVVRAEWNENEGLWHLEIENIRTGTKLYDSCNFLLNASGLLNHWQWPQINGLRDFRGSLVHSANWPKNLCLKEKRVAVIGNGSSGVQIVPAIQPEVKKLVHFVRSPTWISPSQMDVMKRNMGDSLSKIELDGESFPDHIIKTFKEDPKFYHQFVKEIEQTTNAKFNILVNSNQAAAQAKELFKNYMLETLKNDQRLIDAMVPDFPVGCRRITPGSGYLEALLEGNVTVVTENITEISQTGLKTRDGIDYPVDVIVCATGFDVSFIPRFPVIGKKGNLQDIWKDNVPGAYMSLAVAGMPNYFTFMGPNAPIGHGSVFTITEHVAKYVVKMISKCQTQNIKSVTPKDEAIQDFGEHIAKFMPGTAWAGTCRSWFKNGSLDGPVTALHPGGRYHWFHMLEDVRGEDFDYTLWQPNRFRYLGNGYTTREFDGSDVTWYLETPDDLF